MGITGPVASSGGSSFTILVIVLIVAGAFLYIAAMPSVRRKLTEHTDQVREHFFGAPAPAITQTTEASDAAADGQITAAHVADTLGFRYDEFTSRFGANSPELPQEPAEPRDPAPSK